MNSFWTALTEAGLKAEHIIAAVVPKSAPPAPGTTATPSAAVPATVLPAIKAGVATAVMNIEQTRVAAEAAAPGSAITGAAAKMEAVKQFLAFLPMIEQFMAMAGHAIADPAKFEQGVSGMVDGVVLELNSYALIVTAFAKPAV